MPHYGSIHLNNYLSHIIRSLNNEHTLTSSFIILGIAFLYGLIHAAGPGHEKAVVAFYFSSNKGDYKKALKVGYLISIIHTFSALVVTFSLYFLFKFMFREKFENLYMNAMKISVVMIMLIGIYLIYEAYKEKNKKEEIKPQKKSSSSSFEYRNSSMP